MAARCICTLDWGRGGGAGTLGPPVVVVRWLLGVLFLYGRIALCMWTFMVRCALWGG